MKHQKHIIHIPLVKDRQVVKLLLVWEQVPDRMELFSPLTYLCDDEKVRDETLGKEEVRLVICVNALELILIPNKKRTHQQECAIIVKGDDYGKEI